MWHVTLFLIFNFNKSVSHRSHMRRYLIRHLLYLLRYTLNFICDGNNNTHSARFLFNETVSRARIYNMLDIIGTDNSKTRHFYIYRNINIFRPLTQQAIFLSRLRYSSRIGIKEQLRNVNDPTSVSPFEFLDEIIVKIKRWHSSPAHYVSTCVPVCKYRTRKRQRPLTRKLMAAVC